MYCLGCSIHRSTRAEIHSGCWRITSIPRNIACPSSSSLPGTALKMAISVIINYPPCFYIYPIMPGKRLELRSTHNSSSSPPPPPEERKKLGTPQTPARDFFPCPSILWVDLSPQPYKTSYLTP